MGQVVAVHRVRHTPYIRVEKGWRWPKRARVTSIHGSTYFVRTKNIQFVPQHTALEAKEAEGAAMTAADAADSEQAEVQQREGRRELRRLRERGLYHYIEWLMEQEQAGHLLEGDVALKMSGDTHEVLLAARYKVN